MNLKLSDKSITSRILKTNSDTCKSNFFFQIQQTQQISKIKIVRIVCILVHVCVKSIRMRIKCLIDSKVIWLMQATQQKTYTNHSSKRHAYTYNRTHCITHTSTS